MPTDNKKMLVRERYPPDFSTRNPEHQFSHSNVLIIDRDSFTKMTQHQIWSKSPVPFRKPVPFRGLPPLFYPSIKTYKMLSLRPISANVDAAAMSDLKTDDNVQYQIGKIVKGLILQCKDKVRDYYANMDTDNFDIHDDETGDLICFVKTSCNYIKWTNVFRFMLEIKVPKTWEAHYVFKEAADSCTINTISE